MITCLAQHHFFWWWMSRHKLESMLTQDQVKTVTVCLPTSQTNPGCSWHVFQLNLTMCCDTGPCLVCWLITLTNQALNTYMSSNFTVHLHLPDVGLVTLHIHSITKPRVLRHMYCALCVQTRAQVLAVYSCNNGMCGWHSEGVCLFPGKLRVPGKFGWTVESTLYDQ